MHSFTSGGGSSQITQLLVSHRQLSNISCMGSSCKADGYAAARVQRQARSGHSRRLTVEISAIVRNSGTGFVVSVRTDSASQNLAIPPKSSGQGSGVNGGEFLLLALATCYCNDLYREASRLGISLAAVEVEATADFPGIGLAATDIRYRAKVTSPAAASAIAELLRHTDAVAEVHNTVRAGVPVTLVADTPAGKQGDGGT
ncbi:hypothetical protein GCM10009121_22790 [Rhodanobacter soli]